MGDVFGGLTGGPGDPSRTADLSGLEVVLDGAALWGLELEPRFRVLAATVEPRDAVWGEAADRRVQVLCFPVSTILASLRRTTEGRREVLTFEEPQLVDVAAAFGGAPLAGPVFGRPEPRPGTWGPSFSLEGRSSAPDGTGRTVTWSVAADDLQLDVFARFDDLELRDARGEPLALPEGA